MEIHLGQATWLAQAGMRMGLVLGLAANLCAGVGITPQMAYAVDVAPLTPELVKDINSFTYPSNPSQFVNADIGLFFTADDGKHGVELWATDGTLTNTVMASDILLGTNGSSPQGLFGWGAKAFFFANDDTHGAEPWISDGTVSGTFMLRDVNVGGDGSKPTTDGSRLSLYEEAHYAILNDKLLFPANSATHGIELWQTDGTITGTQELVDLKAGAGSAYPHALVLFKGEVYFLAEGDAGSGLWRTDGSAAGTVLVAPLLSAALNDVWMTATDTYILFAGDSGFSGTELWRSDGTAAGTVAVKDIFVGPSSSLVNGIKMQRIGDVVYFVAVDALGAGLWKSDGTLIGTVNLLYGGISMLTSTGNRLYFIADGTSVHQALMTSDGTVTGTKIIKTFGDIGLNATIGALHTISDTAYVVMTEYSTNPPNDSIKTDLWESDGATSSITLVKSVTAPINPVTEPYRYEVAHIDQQIVWNVVGEPWQSDGTSNGTGLLKDINLRGYDANPTSLVSNGTRLYFNANDRVHDQELWTSDGTLTGTQLVQDLSPATGASSHPIPLKMFGDRLYFAAIKNGLLPSSDPQIHCSTHQLFQTNGTLTDTYQLTPDALGIGTASNNSLPCSKAYDFSDPINGNVHLFSAGLEIWRTDGTISGTKVITNFAGASSSSMPVNFTTLGNKVFFQLHQVGVAEFTNRELWVSDGTVTGTQRLHAFDPVAGIVGAGSALNNNYVFFTNTGLWRSDGTPAGTVEVVQGLYGSLVVIGDLAYFTMQIPYTSVDLWQTDGTAAGTKKVLKTPAPVGRFSQSWLQKVGEQLYLIANGYDIWHLNKTTNMFDLVWTASSGEDHIGGPLSNWQGRTVFAGYKHLWAIAGTVTGTLALADLYTDPYGNGGPISFAEINQQLMLPNTGFSGRELYRLGSEANAYVQSNALMFAPPQSAGGTFITYGNRGLSSTLATTLTVTLHPSLTYVSNSLGLTPTVHGAQIIWQIPALGFLDRGGFTLGVRAPDAPLGTQYPITVSIASASSEANLSDNTVVLNMQISSMLALPIVLKS